jgi:hypothetical protein
MRFPAEAGLNGITAEVIESRRRPPHGDAGFTGDRDMTAFRAYLVALFLAIAAYTAIVIARHGMGLYPIFFGDIAKIGWPGQFNLDFLGMLSLSALWTAWRNRFSGTGLLLALLAFNLGAPFLCLYLLVLTAQARGDMAVVLLGPDRAAAR